MIKLPTELLEPILTDALQDSRSSALDLLLIHPRTTQILYRHVYQQHPCAINSLNQLELFSNNVPLELLSKVRALHINLPSAAGSVWDSVGNALTKCRNVQHLKLRAMGLWNEDRRGLIEGLAAIDPINFEWTSPDPPHHISLSVVTPCLTIVLNQLPRWSRLLHLSMSHVQFPQCTHPDRYLPAVLSPTLETISLGQAIKAPATMLAGIATACPRLKRFDAEDIYSESIWGSRVDEKDVRNKLEDSMSFYGDFSITSRLQRIAGGDRGVIY
ncbi:hypothetical protein E3P77_02367 [Wallemia ichthyophaga]|nr:hypothetical protein E3P77_02367 [Wallemia ichthyophaga]